MTNVTMGTASARRPGKSAIALIADIAVGVVLRLSTDQIFHVLRSTRRGDERSATVRSHSPLSTNHPQHPRELHRGAAGTRSPDVARDGAGRLGLLVGAAERCRDMSFETAIRPTLVRDCCRPDLYSVRLDRRQACRSARHLRKESRYAQIFTPH